MPHLHDKSRHAHAEASAWQHICTWVSCSCLAYLFLHMHMYLLSCWSSTPTSLSGRKQVGFVLSWVWRHADLWCNQPWRRWTCCSANLGPGLSRAQMHYDLAPPKGEALTCVWWMPSIYIRNERYVPGTGRLGAQMLQWGLVDTCSTDIKCSASLIPRWPVFHVSVL